VWRFLAEGGVGRRRTRGGRRRTRKEGRKGGERESAWGPRRENCVFFSVFVYDLRSASEVKFNYKNYCNPAVLYYVIM